MARTESGKGSSKSSSKKPVTVSKGQSAAGQRYQQQATKQTGKKPQSSTNLGTVKPSTAPRIIPKLPAPPKQAWVGPAQQILQPNRVAGPNEPKLYVPPGTNEIWAGATPTYAGYELLDSNGAPITYNAVEPATGSNETGGYTGGTGSSGDTGTPTTTPLTWSEKYQLPGSPGYWKGMIPSQWTPETEFATMVNALIPFLSPEDQRQMSDSLSRLFPEGFGNYSPEKTTFPTPANTLPTEVSQYYQSKKRAGEVLSALDRMKEVSGQDESKFGPGYQYLRNIAKTMQDFGIDEDDKRMSKRQIMNMYGALDPLLAESKGEQLGAYGEIARGLTQPFFTAAQMLGVSKDANGNWTFGSANKSWF